MRALHPRSAPATDRGAPTLSRHGAAIRGDQIETGILYVKLWNGLAPGYSLAQNLAVSQRRTESQKSSQQPAREGGSGEGSFCASRDPLTSARSVTGVMKL